MLSSGVAPSLSPGLTHGPHAHPSSGPALPIASSLQGTCRRSHRRRVLALATSIFHPTLAHKHQLRPSNITSHTNSATAAPSSAPASLHSAPISPALRLSLWSPTHIGLSRKPCGSGCSTTRRVATVATHRPGGSSGASGPAGRGRGRPGRPRKDASSTNGSSTSGEGKGAGGGGSDSDVEDGGGGAGAGAKASRSSGGGRDGLRSGSQRVGDSGVKVAFYGVAAGKKTGVLTSWDDTKAAVDGFRGALYRKFSSEAEALAFVVYAASRHGQHSAVPAEAGALAAAAGAAAAGVTDGPTAAPAASTDGGPGGALPYSVLNPDRGVFYAVARGRQVGVMPTWDEARAAVDGCSGAVFKRFRSYADALAFVALHTAPSTVMPTVMPPPPLPPPPTPGSYALQPPPPLPSAPVAATGEAPGASTSASVGDATAANPANPTAAVGAVGTAGGSSNAWPGSTPAPSGASGGVLTAPGVPAVSVVWPPPPSQLPPLGLPHSPWLSGRPVSSQQPAVVSGPPMQGPVEYYAVAKGWKTGVFTSWADASLAVDGYSGAIYRKFKRLAQARAFLNVTRKPATKGTGPPGVAAPTTPPTAPPSRSFADGAAPKEGQTEDAETGVPEQPAPAAAGKATKTTTRKKTKSADAEDAAPAATLGGCGDGGSGPGEEDAPVVVPRRRGRPPSNKKVDADVRQASSNGTGGTSTGGPEAQEDEAPPVQPQQPQLKTLKPSLGEGTSSTETAAQSRGLKGRLGEAVAKAEGLGNRVFDDDPERLLDFSSLGGPIAPDRQYRLEFDGGSRRNPGDAGFGAVLVDCTDGRHVEYVAGPLAASSNNVAEWSALAAGVKLALDMGVQHLVVQGDSELVCRQVSGVYGVNHPGLRPLAARVSQMRARFMTFKVTHVARAENAVADKLSNLGMDAEAAVAEVVDEDERARREAEEQLGPEGPTDGGAAGEGEADGYDTTEEAERRREEWFAELVKHLGEPAVQAARATAQSAAATVLTDAVLSTTSTNSDSNHQPPATKTPRGPKRGGRGRHSKDGGRSSGGFSKISVTECRPPLAARGSVAGSSAEFTRMLIAMALVGRGLLG